MQTQGSTEYDQQNRYHLSYVHVTWATYVQEVYLRTLPNSPTSRIHAQSGAIVLLDSTNALSVSQPVSLSVRLVSSQKY